MTGDGGEKPMRATELRFWESAIDLVGTMAVHDAPDVAVDAVLEAIVGVAVASGFFPPLPAAADGS
jgi:hypothetical protein